MRDYVVENLATDDAVLVIDETGFLKRGKASCGVARQYTGSAGKTTNCQIGVFAAYVSARGHHQAGARCSMERRTLAADVPFSWVAADAVYGVGDVEKALRRACKGYVIGVKSDHHFGSWAGKLPVAGKAEEIVENFNPSAWQRLSAGDGTKGARLYDWAYCELADLDADEYDETQSGLWTRGLLIRRNISGGDIAFFTTWCPAGTGRRFISDGISPAYFLRQL